MNHSVNHDLMKNKRSHEENSTNEQVFKFHKHTPSFRKPDPGTSATNHSCNNNHNVRHYAPILPPQHPAVMMDSNQSDYNMMDMDGNNQKLYYQVNYVLSVIIFYKYLL